MLLIGMRVVPIVAPGKALGDPRFGELEQATQAALLVGDGEVDRIGSGLQINQLLHVRNHDVKLFVRIVDGVEIDTPENVRRCIAV